MKILLILLLSASCLFAQKGHIEGVIYLDKDVDAIYYQSLVKYLTANIDRINAIDGQAIFIVPIERKFKKKFKSRLIDGYLVQYEETIANPNYITIFDIKTKVLEFDFADKKINQKSLDTDDTCFDKPDKEYLKTKIKEKDNKTMKAK